ncbi:hypothetical protein T484DRAFT_3647420, partial [Baffinella frigidus]
NPQPSTRNPQPSIRNPQLSTRNPQPATRNPQPATLNPQPSTLKATCSHTEGWRNLLHRRFGVVKRASRYKASRTIACHPCQPKPRPSPRARRPDRTCPHLQADSFTVTHGHTHSSQGGRL